MHETITSEFLIKNIVIAHLSKHKPESCRNNTQSQRSKLLDETIIYNKIGNLLTVIWKKLGSPTCVHVDWILDVL